MKRATVLAAVVAAIVVWAGPAESAGDPATPALVADDLLVGEVTAVRVDADGARLTLKDAPVILHVDRTTGFALKGVDLGNFRNLTQIRGMVVRVRVELDERGRLVAREIASPLPDDLRRMIAPAPREIVKDERVKAEDEQ